MNILAEKGSKGSITKEAQEWLCYYGFSLVIDGDFGSVTEYMIKEYQKRFGLPQSGKIDERTFGTMKIPITRIKNWTFNPKHHIKDNIITYALFINSERPREIGGNNCGPFVREFTGGNDGAGWLWCSWFVTYVVARVYDQLNKRMPIKRSGSCDVVVIDAQKNKLFIDGKTDKPEPGDLFFTRKSNDDWTHTGIVIEANKDFFKTIEGNTGSGSERDGDGVFLRTRGYGKYDFVKTV